MAIEILMPALSPTMEEGTLGKWLVAEGDKVSSGDILAEIETDKATMEFEAVDEGIIGKLLIAEGTAAVAVNSAIAILLEEGESLSDAVPAAVIPSPNCRCGHTAGDGTGSQTRQYCRARPARRHHVQISNRPRSHPRGDV